MPVPETNEKTASLYETDFYAWTQEQASLLRKHQWSELDLLNLIEEIESLTLLKLTFAKRKDKFTNNYG